MSDPLVSTLLLVGRLWLGLMLHVGWPDDRATSGHPTSLPAKAPRQRSTASPPCLASPTSPLGPRVSTPPHRARRPPGPRYPQHLHTRSRRAVNTSGHCWPAPAGRYGGWLGLGHLTSHGPPTGGPWRQRHGTRCGGYCQETHGTPLHGTRVAPEQLVWAVGALAAGMGMRAGARVVAVDPHTGLAWLVAVADHAVAFSPYGLPAVRGAPGPLDALCARLSAVKAGEGSETEAVERLSRSPRWVWAALAPESTLRLALNSGARTLAMAPRVVHPVVQGLAPGCVPLVLTEGCKESTPARLPQGGRWVHPPRCPAPGPAPKPRWLPRPGLLEAQVGKTRRRRRGVDVTPRGVCGSLEAVEPVGAACRWTIPPAFVARLHLDIRQPGAAVGRRVTPRCQGAEGGGQPWALYHLYDAFCVPHAR
jgi:hypothetical protein